jgi:hypothetical protein
MNAITRQAVQALTAARGPCVSLYLGRHRGGKEGPVRWKNLLAEAADRLALAGMDAAEVRELLTPARWALRDKAFWERPGDGLAWFLSASVDRAYRVPPALPDRVTVGRHFYLKPVLPLLAEDRPFYVLALSQNRVRLLYGTPEGARAVEVKGVPANLEEALRRHDTDNVLAMHTRPSTGGGRWEGIFSGHGVGIDDHKDDLRNYFRQVDRGLHGLLREETAPLVLAAVEYLWPLYREVCTYPHLAAGGVAGNPERLSDRELGERARGLLAPAFEEPRRKAAALYARLAGTGRTSADLAEVVRAAAEGGVEVLFVPADREVMGQLDEAGRVVAHDPAVAGDEDLFNRAAVDTLRHGGTVYAVPAREVPGAAPAAAIFWLPHARKAV